MRLPLTYLFVPGDRPERFDKALSSGADAVIADLEDAVSPDAKAAARAACAKWWAAMRDVAERLLVRINDAATPWFEDDLALVRSAGILGVMLPKAEAASQIDQVRAALAPGGFVVPLIESAQGIVNVEEVAAASGVQRLAFGTLDYAIDLGLSADERGLLYPASRIALASRVARIESPIAGVTTAIDDEAVLLADVAFARACGFGAKLCIHPRQVAAIRRALAPTEAEVAWARRVVAAAESGRGAVQLDGKMIDRPVILKARAILDRAPSPDSPHS